MDIKDSKTVDMLTKDSVSILTQKIIILEGVETQVGDNHRCSYVNSKQGRQELIQAEPENVVNAVLAIWGATATVEDCAMESFDDTGNGGDEPAG